MNQPFYQVKGALPADAPSYIKRDADEKLYNALIENKYCYILNYRQVGKSSLKNSCAKRLEDIGHRCVHIDLTGIGSRDVNLEQWYSSFMFSIIRQLKLSAKKFMEYWNNKNLTVGSRIELIMDELILKESQGRITIFIDEIDFILSINRFNTDNFFALIRRFYNLRGEDKRYKRLTFVLLGVASPNDLMQDSSRTPFNIAENIKIAQLELEQSYGLIDGLGNQTIDKREILKKVFEYTSGTSFLTQKILEYIAKNPIRMLNDIEIIVDKLFIQESFNEVNLSNVQERIIKNQTHNVKMLYVIEQIQNGVEIEYDGRIQTFIYLKLSGLIKEENGILAYSNLIYERIFNACWLEKMIDKLDRPIVKYLQKWEKNGMSNSYLLKEETLKEIDKWAFQRTDVLAKEHEFISRSHQEKNRRDRIRFEKERKKYNEKLLKHRKEFDNKLLEEERKYNNELLKQKKESDDRLLDEEKKSNKKLLKQKRKLIVSLSILALGFILVGGGAFYSNYIQEEKLKINKERVEKEKLELELKLELERENTKTFYKNLIKATSKYGTEEYYLWKISLFENIDDKEINYKMAEEFIKLANLYIKNSRFNEAEKYYKKAINIYKNDVKFQEKLLNLYFKLAQLYEKEKRLDSAEEYYIKMIYIYKKNSKYQEKLANLCYRLDYLGIDYLNIALRIYSKNRYKEKYKVQRANIYYKLMDEAILRKDIKKAEELDRKVSKIYNELLLIKTDTYIDVLPDILVKKANISLLKRNKKEAKKLYQKALKIYKERNSKLHQDKIDKVKEKLKVLKNSKVKSRHGEGWVYIGKFIKDSWNRQYFWLEKSNTLKLKGSRAISVSGVKVREKPSPRSKMIGGISMGSIVDITKTAKRLKEKEIHIWAYVKY